MTIWGGEAFIQISLSHQLGRMLGFLVLQLISFVIKAWFFYLNANVSDMVTQ